MKAPRPAVGKVSFAAAARRVDCAPQTLSKLIKTRQFPEPFILGTRKYFWETQIEQWLAQAYVSTGLAPDGSRPPA